MNALFALHVVNEVRRARVVAPRDTADGMAQLDAEIESLPRWPRHLTVAEMLHWPYRSEARHRHAILRNAGLSDTRTVASLTAREVGVLCHALRNPAIWRDHA